MEYQEIWAGEESFIREYVARRSKINIDKVDPQAFFFFQESKKLTLSESVEKIMSIENDVASIKIEGALRRGGPDFLDTVLGYNIASYRTIREALRIAGANSQVKSIKLLMDTPGGRVPGVDLVWKDIRAITKKKKVIVEVYGMLASAGYYIASAANAIYATSETDQIGSIGVLIVTVDWSEYDAKSGIKDVIIYSRNAPNKYPDVSKDSGIAILQKRVDVIEERFLGRIAEGRGVDKEYIIKNYGQGGILVAESPGEEFEDALSVKMIDGVINGGVILNNGSVAINSQTGQNLANNKQEKVNMSFDLAKLMADNPELKAEFEKERKEGYQAGLVDGKKASLGTDDERYKAGIEAGKEEMKRQNKFVASILTSVHYQEPVIMQTATEVMSGETSHDTLKALVKFADMQAEKDKSKKAQAETTKIGETAGDPPKGSDQKEVIQTKDDFEMGIKSQKALRNGGK